MPDAVIHPTLHELTAFGLGKLPERAAAVVAAHLVSCPACHQAVAGVGADANSPCEDVPPELAHHPKYHILRELGRGGMGVVYLARQNGMMDRQIVIKVINRSLIDNPQVLGRFRREVQAASQLSHPNIVTAYDAEMAGELHLLVMEFVPGHNLADVLDTKGPLPVASACLYARQAARALQHAHQHGMVHRDIKPENLMLTPQNQIKVLDFGIAKVVSEHGTSAGLTAANSYIGTPEYSAPEQATDTHSADIRADLYSLGCTLYCLLAGRPPFQEDTAMDTLRAHFQKKPQPLPQLRPDVPAELWQVVARLLAKKPEQRYQKPSEVVQALAPFVKSAAKSEANSGSAPVATTPHKGTVIEEDTRPLDNALPEVPDHTPPEEVSARGYRLWPVLAGVGVLLALLGMWASGVLKLKTKPEPLVAKTDAPMLENVSPKPETIKPETAKPVVAVAKELPPRKVEKRDARTLFKVRRGLKGKWIIVDDHLEQTSFDANVCLYFGDPAWKDYDFAVEVMQGKGNDQVCQMFRIKTGQGVFIYGLGYARNSLFTIEKQRPGSNKIFGTRKGHLVQGKWYKMLVRARGKHLQCFLNTTKIFDFESDEHPTGCVGLRTWGTQYRFRNIKVTAPDGTVLLEGLPDLNHELPDETGLAP